MAAHPDFVITAAGPVSAAFTARNMHTFADAALWIKELPYGRNYNKRDLTTLFSDHCGTCSTKHAVLRELADENHFGGIRLMLGIFRMNGMNTPAISQVLSKHSLDYIPEAHNYIRFGNDILDCTTAASKPSGFINDLVEEAEISVDQITDYKVNYHRNYLAGWLKEHPDVRLTQDELWAIREECILALSSAGKKWHGL